MSNSHINPDLMARLEAIRPPPIDLSFLENTDTQPVDQSDDELETPDTGPTPELTRQVGFVFPPLDPPAQEATVSDGEEENPPTRRSRTVLYDSLYTTDENAEMARYFSTDRIVRENLFLVLETSSPDIIVSIRGGSNIPPDEAVINPHVHLQTGIWYKDQFTVIDENTQIVAPFHSPSGVIVDATPPFWAFDSRASERYLRARIYYNPDISLDDQPIRLVLSFFKDEHMGLGLLQIKSAEITRMHVLTEYKGSFPTNSLTALLSG